MEPADDAFCFKGVDLPDPDPDVDLEVEVDRFCIRLANCCLAWLVPVDATRFVGRFERARASAAGVGRVTVVDGTMSVEQGPP